MIIINLSNSIRFFLILFSVLVSQSGRMVARAWWNMVNMCLFFWLSTNWNWTYMPSLASSTLLKLLQGTLVTNLAVVDGSFFPHFGFEHSLKERTHFKPRQFNMLFEKRRHIKGTVRCVYLSTLKKFQWCEISISWKAVLFRTPKIFSLIQKPKNGMKSRETPFNPQIQRCIWYIQSYKRNFSYTIQ